MHLGLILWSLLPGALWAHWLYKRDVFQPEPLGLVAKAFFVGMLLTAPAIALSASVRVHLPVDPTLAEDSWIWAFEASFLRTAPLEEALKFAAVYLFFFHHKEFDEPIDGLIYSGTVALGFASAENIFYLAQYGAEVLPSRAFLAVPGHFLFAASFGYAMGLRTVPATPDEPRRLFRAPWDLAAALLVSIAAHGAYNFCLLLAQHQQQPTWGWFGALVVLGVLGILWRSYVVRLDRLSPFRPS